MFHLLNQSTDDHSKQQTCFTLVRTSLYSTAIAVYISSYNCINNFDQQVILPINAKSVLSENFESKNSSVPVFCVSLTVLVWTFFFSVFVIISIQDECYKQFELRAA